jgi:cytochrome c oxidase cbb3-type subunit 3
MRLPVTLLLLLGPAALATAACDRGVHGEDVGMTSSGIAVSRSGNTGPQAVLPGIHPAVVYGERVNPYTGDAAAIQEGRRLFVAYNCSGCHGGRAGGGMGPALRDSLWSHGNSDTQIFGTIIEGRAAGMPAWGKVIPEDQIWKIIAYIRTLGTPAEPDKVLQ